MNNQATAVKVTENQNSNKTKKMPLEIGAVLHSKLSLSDEIELEIAKIFFLANQINRKTEMCCFAYDTAHCGYIEINLQKTKQDYKGVPVVFKLSYDISGNLDWNGDTQERLDNAKKCVEFLEQTLNDRMINYSILNALKEYVIKSYEI